MPHRTGRFKPVLPVLGTEASAELRDRLLGELSRLTGGDDAALWAHRCLPEKNRLTTADAQLVEAGFRKDILASSLARRHSRTPDQNRSGAGSAYAGIKRPKKRRSKPRPVDKSVLALSEPRRVRDRDHVRYVADKPA